jgi:predicted NAD/FAD-binding protein
MRTGTPVTSVTRLGGSTLIGSPGSVEEFEQVVIATHSDQALRILGHDATDEERRLLGTISYRDNAVVLHTDNRLMPASHRLWSSWNAISTPGGDHASVTYWMNSLQRLDTGRDVFVSLNPLRPAEPARTLGSYRYAHPQYGPDSIRAQAEIASIQGRHNTWFAGAYLGYGFHEDGLQSGLNVAAALGSPAPWHASITPMSSAPILGSAVAV